MYELVELLSCKYLTEKHTLTSILIFAYIISGSDSVSYIYRRVKRKAVKIALQKMGQYTELSRYGLSDELDVTDGISYEARAFIVSLYVTGTFEDLNVLREHIFASS